MADGMSAALFFLLRFCHVGFLGQVGRGKMGRLGCFFSLSFVLGVLFYEGYHGAGFSSLFRKTRERGWVVR